MKLRTILAATAAIGLGAGALPAAAETFRAATWNVSGSPNDVFLNDFADQVREATGGEIDFEIFPGGVLLPADGTLPGIASGVAQLANITAAYIPSDMPVDAVTADLSFAADDQLALAFAKTEVGFFNEQMQKEIRGHDLVFVTSFSIGIYYPICSFDLSSVDDLDGRKVRTSSATQIEFATQYGAVPVSVPASEIYTGIQRGSLDCAFGDALFLTDYFKLNEVAQSVYRLPLGSNATGGYYMNEDFWAERTPEERRAMFKALSRATARSMIGYQAKVDQAWEAAEAAGVALNEPSEADMAALAEFNEAFIAKLAQSEMDKRGIDDPTQLIDDMVAAMDKWKGLLEEVDTTDLDAVTALLDQEIFDRIDVETYGLD
ncbi:C4-dicarboxylate TRAP transporter substrate-binding protein [Salipiger abyssi]|uniref:TRAP-type C4-dicarboxylate transport system, periplasmic component n=1 Tax=Salipiger abyssi TaxID=1250539 RepID=A0A1P8V0T1_9RHOB|nr:C4-dicarboxylate TRAP transporter substrate-binding protein [Salipiger abyssi]APZ55239.1 TRAP-type C4-dicarboxylate transport system, periplasmic component [Salipiger abyssi]